MGLFGRRISKDEFFQMMKNSRVVKMKDYLKDPSLNANNGMGLNNQLPVATDHKHSSGSKTPSNSGNFGPRGGDGVMDAEELNDNKFANQKIQQLGKNLFQGEEMAEQMANQRLDQPLAPPGPYGDMNPIMNKESREARRQERKNIRMANKALRSARRERAKGVKEQGQENYSYDGYEKGRYNKKGDDIEYGKVKRYSKKNPPSGSDASFGISGYVNNKKQFKSALNQNDPNKGRPYVVNKEKTGTSKDTLFLPKNAYVSNDGYMDDVEYEQEAKKAAAKGIYNYIKSSNFENLEGSGEVKYKK